MTTSRPTIVPPNDFWAVLPAHEWGADGTCIHCGDAPLWNTYEEYTAHFWAHEYEGELGHRPDPREEFEYLRDSCLK